MIHTASLLHRVKQSASAMRDRTTITITKLAMADVMLPPEARAHSRSLVDQIYIGTRLIAALLSRLDDSYLSSASFEL
jgi:hypothetical protein